jgi:hypothetical protein
MVWCPRCSVHVAGVHGCAGVVLVVVVVVVVVVIDDRR